MNRLQIDFKNPTQGFIPMDERLILQQIHNQYGRAFGSAYDFAIHIRDDLGLNKCTKIMDTFIFTKTDESKQ